MGKIEKTTFLPTSFFPLLPQRQISKLSKVGGQHFFSLIPMALAKSFAPGQRNKRLLYLGRGEELYAEHRPTADSGQNH